jgi:hypothetical protein
MDALHLPNPPPHGAPAQGCSPAVRALDWASIVGYSALLIWLGVRLWPAMRASPWWALTAALVGYLAADLVSGLVHWGADTWGSEKLPGLGRAFLRPFREHHVDPTAITRHDFVETNGNNCLVSIPTLALALVLAPSSGEDQNPFWSAVLGFLVLWVMGTNQFHKWAHLESPRGAVALMQRLHLILPPAHHATHHAYPYTRSYCITTGWMNAPLNAVGFFRILERWITALSGALPRREDLGAAGARANAPEAASSEGWGQPTRDLSGL